MNFKSIALAALTLVAFTSASFAACKEYVTVTPDNAPVQRSLMVGTGGNSQNGDAYSVATFCPKAAAAGTCTGKTLSEAVSTSLTKFVTLDGVVADITQHRNGIQIGPVFIPTTGLLPDACS